MTLVSAYFNIFEVYTAEGGELLQTRQRLLQVRVEVELVLPNLLLAFGQDLQKLSSSTGESLDRQPDGKLDNHENV